MDWLTFKFCVLIWILCVSKSQSQLPPLCNENQLYPAQNKCNACMCKDGFITCTNNVCEEEPTTTTTTTRKPKKKKKCEEGSRLPGPNPCLDCICQNGNRRCKFICKPIVENSFQGPECYPGQQIARPDDCNNCICFEGKIHCTHLPCHMYARLGPQCTDDQQVYRPDECNECYCIEGQLECSDLICIRGSKCVAGQVIPKPDSCNTCKCVEEHILCTNHLCSITSRNVLLPGPPSIDVMPLEECQEGDYIPPPLPPNDCNTCYCMDNRIVCTMISCDGPIPEFKGRVTAINGKANLDKFDKKISVEPFIHILYTKNDKIPHKLIHSHTYNGFHQEVKVHASHLPKDTTKLLNVLANSLDNTALASISQTLLTSNPVPSNQDSMKPFDHSVVQTNQLGARNVLSAQSSKLITSGSQSNETYLVFPHTEPLDNQDSQSVLPLDTKHEMNWKTVSAPDTLVYHNGKQIYDNPPSMIATIDPNPIILNPAKFGRPGQHDGLPTKPTWDAADTHSIPTQSIYPTLHTEPISVNDGKIIYAPFSQENEQIKPAPISFAAIRDELPLLRPWQQTKPGPNLIFNHSSPTSVFRLEQYKLNPDNDDNVGQQKSSQYQFAPNPSNFYPNQGTLQLFQSKPKRIPSLPINYYKNEDVPLPSKFLDNPNRPIASADQYKSPQFGLNPAPESSNPNNIHLNLAPINLPLQKQRISTIDNETPEFEPNSKVQHSDILNPSQNEVKPNLYKQPNSPQSQLIPNPSIYYKNEYEAPKLIEEIPDQDQLTPNSIISYKPTEDYDPLHTPSESGHEKLPNKVHNKTKKNNTTHSHYEKPTPVIYVSKYDPNDPDDPTLVDHDLNEQYNSPPKYAYEHYFSDENSQEFDLSKKVDYYLNIPYLQLDQNEPRPKSIQSYLTPTGQRHNDTQYPTITEINKYDQPDSWNITNKQFEEYPLSPSKSTQTDIKTNQEGNYSVSPIFAIYLHNPSEPELVFPLDNSETEDAEDPAHSKSNDPQPPPSQTGPSQNQHTPGVFDDEGSDNGFQYSHNAYEDPKQFKPLHKLPPHELETPHNHQLPGIFDEREPADDVQNPFNLAEDLTHPKVKLNESPHLDPYKSMLNPQQPKHNQNIPPYSQFGPTQNQFVYPGDNRGVKDRFQYAHYENEDHRELKPFLKLPPFLTHDKQTPGMFDERGSPDGFRHPSNLAENPTHSRGNLHNLPPNQFGPDKKRLPVVFDDHGSADGFHYPSSADISLLPKDKLNDLFIKHGPTEKQHDPWRFDDHESAGGSQNPPSSTENFSFPKSNIQNLLLSKLDPNPNQRLPGVFDGPGSTDGLHYPTKSAKLPFQPKYNNLYKPQNNLYKPQNNLYKPQNIHKQHVSGDDRGSANNLHYPSKSAKNPFNSKNNLYELSNSLFRPILNKPTQDSFGNREPMGGPQYTFNFAEDPKHPKVLSPHSPLGPTKDLPGIFDERGDADGFQYQSHSGETSLHPKSNQQNPSHLQLGPNQNQHLPGMFDERGPDSFQFPSNSVENPTHPKHNLYNSAENPLHQKDYHKNSSHPQLGPDQNQHMPGVFDDHGSADRFHYPSDSVEDPQHPNDNPDTTPESNFKLSQNQPKPENQPTSNNYNNNPVEPWTYLDHDQYKPSSFDNPPNGVQNISWSLPEDHDTVVNTYSSTRPQRFEPDYDQYKPSSFDNLFNGMHHMLRPVPNQDNNALESNAELTTPQSVFKPEQDQYENKDLFGEDDDHLQKETDISTDLINSDSMQNNPNHRIKPDNVPHNLLLTDDGKFPDYYDQLYPLFIALKKLSEPSNDDSGLSSLDKVDLLPILFPGIADILNYNPSKKPDDKAPDVNQPKPLKKLKLTDNDNRILNWLKSKLNKFIPTKGNTTATKNEIDLPEIFSLLSKLTSNEIKTSAENISFNGFDPEIVEKIMNDFKEDTQTVKPTPRTAETTNDNDNRFLSVPTALEEAQQQDTKKNPEVHIILYQPDDEADVNLPPYIKTDGEPGLATDMGPEEVHSPLFPNMFYPRFTHRPKDQKDECGDGTQWISNCHNCFCYFGQTMCLRMQNCKLRPFGEPMICKPYSHFKMGCYICECNGDGIAECDATDCGKESTGKRQGSHELALPIFHEFFDNEKENEILQYYNLYKKLPKDCPRPNSETEYPTCERGTSWISSCHKCECNERSQHECTKIHDCVLDFDSYGKPGRCKPNSKFYPKTNSMPCVECLCNDEGIPYCPEADLKKH